MGKTTLAQEIVVDEDRVFILDLMGGYEKDRHGKPLADVVWGRDASIEAMLEASQTRRFKLALRCIEQYEMLDVLEMAWEVENTLVVIEETSFLCSPTYLPPQLARLVRYGRHREISQLYIARRPSEIHRDLTAQSDAIVTFQQKETRDLAYLQASGFDPARVVGLPPYRCEAVGDPIPFAALKHLWQTRLTLAPAVGQQIPLTEGEESVIQPAEEGDAEALGADSEPSP